ncbi:DUF7660 family protein [Myceligenerans indicum]|uniref:DUF7660 domain-containing protein n=1 Tax=Myceligenerans indicum TaxID=2593663 RepID=A0ABS1LR00_9MICO|nr:hypothetical protein [Myceligenerans indicum]MBL0888727.1 hypothetical protein [Myceligenerans indicum]
MSSSPGFSRTTVLLSLQRALWDAVTPGLRGVTMRLSESKIEGRMLYDHDPDATDREDCSLVETHVLADLPDDVAVRLKAVAVVPPEERMLLAAEEWVYLRKEPAPPQPWHPHPNPAATPLLDSPRTRDELASFIDDLASTSATTPDAWENATLPDYLDALAAWTRDLDGYYLGNGEPVPETPSWNLIARMLHAATTYE